MHLLVNLLVNLFLKIFNSIALLDYSFYIAMSNETSYLFCLSDAN